VAGIKEDEWNTVTELHPDTLNSHYNVYYEALLTSESNWLDLRLLPSNVLHIYHQEILLNNLQVIFHNKYCTFNCWNVSSRKRKLTVGLDNENHLTPKWCVSSTSTQLHNLLMKQGQKKTHPCHSQANSKKLNHKHAQESMTYKCRKRRRRSQLLY